MTVVSCSRRNSLFRSASIPPIALCTGWEAPLRLEDDTRTGEGEALSLVRRRTASPIVEATHACHLYRNVEDARHALRRRLHGAVSMLEVEPGVGNADSRATPRPLY